MTKAEVKVLDVAVSRQCVDSEQDLFKHCKDASLTG